MTMPEVEKLQQPDLSQPEAVAPPESAESIAQQPVVAEQPSQGAQSQQAVAQQQVQDDNVQVQAQDDTPVFTIPQNEAILEVEAKGPIESPLTWFANFWLRMIKKAIHLGKRIVVGVTSKQ